MKLSKKGFTKILSTCSFDEDLARYSLKYSDCNKDYFFEIEEVEFEQDDFKDVITLTVEEAKAIAVTMFALHKFCQTFLSGVNDNFLIKASKVNHVLDKRIEQAEGQNESSN